MLNVKIRHDAPFDSSRLSRRRDARLPPTGGHAPLFDSSRISRRRMLKARLYVPSQSCCRACKHNPKQSYTAALKADHRCLSSKNMQT